MEITIKIMEFIGTVAFALSGAIVAMKKNMDIMGINILALTTAVGGGILRDVILGITPPMVFRNPLYIICPIISASIFAFIVSRNYKKNKNGKIVFSYAFYEKTLTLLDAIGLGAFSVIGVGTALATYPNPGIILLIFVGMATGVGGGIIRDIMAQNMPMVFVKHIYASASLIGSVTCILLWKILPNSLAMLIGSILVVIIRLLSSHFKWNLPKFSM